MGEAAKMSKKSLRMQKCAPAPGRRFSRRALGVLAGLLLAVGVLAPASPAAADTQWDIKTVWGETEMRPGSTAMVAVTIRNIGRTTAVGQVKIADYLPQGVTVDKIFEAGGWLCFGETTLICKAPLEADPLYFDIGGDLGRVEHRIQFTVNVSPDASGIHPNIATVSGGGASGSDVDPIRFGDPGGSGEFGFVPSSVEGDDYTDERPHTTVEHQAGSHPFEQRQSPSARAPTCSPPAPISSREPAALPTRRSAI
jgi:uncharacterized repeat protein (TIGR01451 family)